MLGGMKIVDELYYEASQKKLKKRMMSFLVLFRHMTVLLLSSRRGNRKRF